MESAYSPFAGDTFILLPIGSRLRGVSDGVLLH
jgi:hypothetical protein